MQQNLARQYATNFGKRSAKDPSSHHLIQNTESVLVTTTMDLISPRPRGDGVSRSADDAVAEPRGFFADQFEVSFSWLVPPLYAPPARSCGFSVELFTSYDWERARDSVDQRRLRDSPWPIYPGPHIVLSATSAHGHLLRPRCAAVLWFPVDTAWDLRPLFDLMPVCRLSYGIRCFSVNYEAFYVHRNVLQPAFKLRGVYENEQWAGKVCVQDLWRISWALRSMLHLVMVSRPKRQAPCPAG